MRQNWQTSDSMKFTARRVAVVREVDLERCREIREFPLLESTSFEDGFQAQLFGIRGSFT